MHRICPIGGFVFMLALSVGCSPPPKGAAPAAKVKGIAKLDGKPIASGELHFSVADFPPRVVEIKDGAYAGEAPVGKNKVELLIYVEEKSEKYGKSIKKNTAPEKYWGPNTVLAADVSANGDNEFKFEISTK